MNTITQEWRMREGAVISKRYIKMALMYWSERSGACFEIALIEPIWSRVKRSSPPFSSLMIARGSAQIWATRCRAYCT